MLSTLLSTIIVVLVVRENKDLLGVCYQISPQLRLSRQEEVSIIESSMRKESSL
jgi:hypothetical protein